MKMSREMLHIHVYVYTCICLYISMSIHIYAGKWEREIQNLVKIFNSINLNWNKK